MSDGTLSQKEIDEILFEEGKKDFEKRKQKILKDIYELGILDIDIIGGQLNLDAIEAVIRIIKNNKKRLDKNAGEL